MGEAEFARFTLAEIRQQYGESTPRRQFLFRRLQTVTRLLSKTGSLLDVFQHDLGRLYYHADVFWVTEVVGREHIEAMLAVFFHDRHGALQPIVEVTV